MEDNDETALSHKNVDSKQKENQDVLPIKASPFFPNFNNEMMKNEYPDFDSDEDLGFRVSELVIASESEDIFKVWELDVPVEEYRFVNEFKGRKWNDRIENGVG
ncbi:hypothetical protein L2E82_42818 [Cichorium intybus]|uniref:Uncharacterized protein n=1 Tax=Cichorium intybus TaxID=13427 RepID=A0ACB8ZMX8_CICIN|nr:hypothetical protein L2E82_42818 [Cichorium intybus]